MFGVCEVLSFWCKWFVLLVFLKFVVGLKRNVEKSFVCYYLKLFGIYKLMLINIRKWWSCFGFKEFFFFFLGKEVIFVDEECLFWLNVFLLFFYNIIYLIFLLKIWLDDEFNCLEIFLLLYYLLFNLFRDFDLKLF